MTTTNLADFGYRELDMLKDLITAIEEDGLPEDFENDEVVPMFNTVSGNVFLTNSEFQVAMINENTGRLESFYYLSYNGNEGFVDDLVDEFENDEIDSEDFEQFEQICRTSGRDDIADRVLELMGN